MGSAPGCFQQENKTKHTTHPQPQNRLIFKGWKSRWPLISQHETWKPIEKFQFGFSEWFSVCRLKNYILWLLVVHALRWSRSCKLCKVGIMASASYRISMSWRVILILKDITHIKHLVHLYALKLLAIVITDNNSDILYGHTTTWGCASSSCVPMCEFMKKESILQICILNNLNPWGNLKWLIFIIISELCT